MRSSRFHLIAALFLIIINIFWTVIATDARCDDGDILWEFGTISRIESSPAILGDGTVLFGGNDNRFYALDDDGDELWRFSTGGDVSAAPAIGTTAEGALRFYVASEDGNLYVLDKDGNELWRFNVNAEIHSSPAIWLDESDTAHIYFGTDDNRLYCLRDTGTSADLKWRFVVDGAVRSSPLVDREGAAVFGSDDGNLYAVDFEGNLIWSFPTGGAIRSSPAIGDGDNAIVYVGSDDGSIYAVDFNARALLWSRRIGDRIRSSPVTDEEGNIYIGSDNGMIYAFDTEGNELWTNQERFATAIETAPAIGADGLIYVGTVGGRLHAIEPEQGAEDWSVLLEDILTSPVIAADGTLYVGTEDDDTAGRGRLFAIETSAGGIESGASWPMFGHDVRRTGRTTTNRAPDADAGEDREAIDGETVELDASGSYDIDFGIRSYSWSQTAGEAVELSDASAIRPTFVAPNVEDEETFTFELTVTDNGNRTSRDAVNIVVTEDDGFCFIRRTLSKTSR